MIRRLLAIVLLSAVAAHAMAGGFEGTYRIVLSETAEAADVFKGCACTVDDQDGRFVVRASRAIALRLASDPRVATVEELAAGVPRLEFATSAAPAEVRSDAVASWTSGTYEYDGAGNITQIGSDLYTYDAAGRLETSRTSSVVEEYTYDRYGNRISTRTTEPSSAQYTSEAPVGTNNRLTAAQYDAAGRMLVASGLGVVYDELDMPSEITTGGLRRVHLYSASDERIATVTFTALNNGLIGTDWTLRDTSGKVLRRLHQDRYGTWSWQQDYIYRDSVLLASEVASEHRTLHYFPDHLGTPRLITNHNGAQVGVHKYYPFGREQTNPNQNPELLKFTGHERDAALLDYMHARYYGVEWGRFLSVDPTWESADLGKPQSWNRYAYVMNNPVNMTDPDGRTPAVAWWLIRTFGPAVARYVAREVIVSGAQATRLAMSEYAAQRLSGFEYARPVVVPAALSQGAAPSIAWPGWDSTSPPEGFSEWRGKKGAAPGTNAVGAWVNPETGEYLSPDLDHAEPKGPHWTYGDENGEKWDVYPDGEVVPRGTDRTKKDRDTCPGGEDKCDPEGS